MSQSLYQAPALRTDAMFFLLTAEIGMCTAVKVVTIAMTIMISRSTHGN